jgi:hypothetical protein
MTLTEAKSIAANPANHPEELRLARLKLWGAALRAYPSSPTQKAIRALITQIEAMPRDLWSLK